MHNPIDYLWYRLYIMQETYAAKSMAFALSINVLTIIVLIYRHFPDWWLVIGILGLFLMFHYERRIVQARILKKYRCESKKSRKTGSVIVIIYIILSSVAVFLIPYLISTNKL
jgi:hypothetical protein